jgi:hypothetical protein
MIIFPTPFEGIQELIKHIADHLLYLEKINPVRLNGISRFTNLIPNLSIHLK